mmetsp:Transcript_28281/g.21138  ORF Transcript_28281/g.21138 Transcript_28281/m.21138 type:complete len:80 (-) Transcript_28281:357-596(-)
MSESYNPFKNQEYLFKGAPLEVNGCLPLVLLIPHLRSNPFNVCVSFGNISNVIINILLSSFVPRPECLKALEMQLRKER